MPALLKKAVAEVVYPEILLRKAWGKDAITPDLAKKLLGWKDEDDYAEEIKAANPNVKGTPSYGSDYDFKDENDKPVRCLANDKNRPFDEVHARKLAQDILHGQWAGPTAMPEETINGETVVISQLGKVKSGQHRLIGVVLAGQIWEKDKNKWPLWKDGPPVLETVLVYGTSDNERVTATLDNVKTRTLSDTLYTSDIFLKLGRSERLEMSKMLDASTDLLWKRTGEAKMRAGAEGVDVFYQTHSASRDFIDRHPKLKKACEVIFKLNEERHLNPKTGISQSGYFSALLYLMGSSTSDREAYRSPKHGMPSEKSLEWTNWDKAIEFWTAIPTKQLKPIGDAIAKLMDAEGGGFLVEKLAIVAKGWLAYVEGGKLTADDVKLDWEERNGKNVLAHYPTVGGIDLGDKPTDLDEPPDQAEIEGRKAEEQHKKKNGNGAAKLAATAVPNTEQAAAARNLGKGSKAQPGSMRDELDKLAELYPNKLIILKGAGGFNLWGDSAKEASQILRLPAVVSHEKLLKLTISPENLETAVAKLVAAGNKVAVIDQKGQEIRAGAPPVKQAGKPANGKPAAAGKPAPAQVKARLVPGGKKK